MKRLLLLGIALLSAVALVVPMAGQATSSKSYKNDGRLFYATDNQGNLLSFSADRTRSVQSSKRITGLPPMVSLTGIDFRPATGDLYGVGSDSVVYRVNPMTAIAVAEGPAFTPGVRGRFFGVDFNPAVDRIRLTSDANQNQRLHPDDGNVLMGLPDADLNPNDPTIVGSAYLNSSFSVVRPAATTLFALDALDDAIYRQDPPKRRHAGRAQAARHQRPRRRRLRHRRCGQRGLRRHRLRPAPRRQLFRVDVTTGDTKRLGTIGRGGLVITGLAAVQDQP